MTIMNVNLKALQEEIKKIEDKNQILRAENDALKKQIQKMKNIKIL